MNKQMKNVLLVGMTILLLSACGPLEAAPASADTPGPVVTPGPVENIPTAVLADTPDPERSSKYIGLIYPPLPAGLFDDFSMLIQDSNDHSFWLVSGGGGRMLWLSKLTHYDSDGNAYWEVKDVLELSNLESGVTLIPDGCLLNGKADNEILAVSKNNKALLAWRASTTLDSFEAISTNGIECHSDKAVSLE